MILEYKLNQIVKHENNNKIFININANRMPIDIFS